MLWLGLSCSLLGQVVSGQQSAPSASSAAKVQADASQKEEAYVIEQSLLSQSYEADGTGTFEDTTRVHLLSDAGVERFGLLTLSYQKNFESADFDYVRVRKPDGKVVNTPLEEVHDIEAEITRAAPYYSDLRERQIAVRGVGVGDTVEWRSTTHILKALVPGHFWTHYWFTKYANVQDEEFRLSVPKDLYIKVKSQDPQPKIQEEGSRRIYDWKRSQLKREEEDPKLKYGLPFKQPQPDVEVSTFKSWEEIGHWYDSLQRDRVAPSAEIKAKALELTKDAKDEDEKIRSLYDFVATHFRYIGVAFGIGRYQPHSASDVLDRSYGDCKDKHTLLASLLAAIGVQASPVLISSRHTLDRDVPSPSQFDHVITAVHRGKDLTWLDATSEVAPFGMLTANLRDKEALVIGVDGSSQLIRTPDKPGVEPFENLQLTGELSDSGELRASMQHQVRGDSEILMRHLFHSTGRAEWKDLVRRYSQVTGFGGSISDVEATAPENTREPFHLKYKYDRTDYSDWVRNKRISVPLPWISIPGLSDDHEKSGQPVYLGAPTNIDYQAELKLPKGYTPQLPADVDAKTDFAEYHSKYSIQDGVLHAERQVKVLVKEVSSSQFGKYREFLHKLDDDQGAWVTFTGSSPAQTSTAQSTAPPTQDTSPDATTLRWPAPPDTDAGREFKDGLAFLRLRRYDAALAKLEEAAQRNPRLPGVWVSLSTIHWMKGRRDEALEDRRRQTRETPELAIAWASLAYYLLQLQEREQAIPVLKRWVELAPEDTLGIVTYGRTLTALKKYPEAIELFQNQLNHNPRDRYYLGLAQAYLGSGQSEQAFENYKKAIDIASEKSPIENDAAYELADKNLHLSEAEEWATAAVHDAEQESANLSLEKLDRKSFLLMNQISTFWDSLGWIYFRKGEYRKSEQYLNASWWLRQ